MNIVAAVAQTNRSPVKYSFGAAAKLEPLVRQADVHLVYRTAALYSFQAERL